MKLSAIANRGSKKDFYDIYFLLKEFTLKEMIELFNKKFPDVNLFYVIKSLLYFKDAEDDLEPKLLKPVSWEDVKKEIQRQVELYF